MSKNLEEFSNDELYEQVIKQLATKKDGEWISPELLALFAEVVRRRQTNKTKT